MFNRKEYDKTRYWKRRKEIIDILGGKCTRCLEADISKLQVDHINKENKKFTLGKEWTKPWETILEELKSCQLLCMTCHQQKSFEYNDVNPKSEHGKRSMYVYHKCRCELCKKSNTEYSNKLKQNKPV